MTFEGLPEYDSMDRMIHKILTFMTYNQKQYIKQLIRYTAQYPSLLSHVLLAIAIIVRKCIDENCIQPNPAKCSWNFMNIYTYLNTHLKFNYTANTRMVDMNAHDGYLLHNLKQHIKDTDGINLRDENLFCVQRNNETPNYDDVINLPWKNNVFSIESNSIDIVICIDILQYLTTTSLHITLNEIMRILKPNGILLVRCRDYVPDTAYMLKWEHHLYHILDEAYLRNSFNPDDYLVNKVYNFKSKETWENIIGVGDKLSCVDRKNKFLNGEYQKSASTFYWDVYVKN